MAKSSLRVSLILFVLTSVIVIGYWRPLTEHMRDRLAVSQLANQQSPSDTQIYLHTGKPKTPDTIEFPLKIWQTSKDSVASLDEGTWSTVKSWTDRNPDFRHEFLTSDISNTYVMEKFSEDQRVRDTFLSLRASILRADLIRYLVLFADGGVYNDLDVKCLKPVHDWLPLSLKKKASIVVGIEVDKQMNDGIYRVGFASWTIMTKPNHPAMEHVVQSVVSNLHALAETQNTTVTDIQPTYEDVIRNTGPRAFSQAIYSYLSKSTGTKVDYHNFTGITEPALMEDILVLPINSFGSGQGHSGSGSPSDESALVQHLWKGSWKKKPSASAESLSDQPVKAFNPQSSQTATLSDAKVLEDNNANANSPNDSLKGSKTDSSDRKSEGEESGTA